MPSQRRGGPISRAVRGTARRCPHPRRRHDAHPSSAPPAHGAAKGTAAGADGGWLRGLGAFARGSLLVGLTATAAAAVAMVARNAAAAIGAASAYIVVVEPAVHIWRPGLVRWLPRENAAIFLLGRQSPTSFTRSVTAAAVLLVVFAVVAAAAAAAVVRRRDVTA